MERILLRACFPQALISLEPQIKTGSGAECLQVEDLAGSRGWISLDLAQDCRHPPPPAPTDLLAAWSPMEHKEVAGLTIWGISLAAKSWSCTIWPVQWPSIHRRPQDQESPVFQEKVRIRIFNKTVFSYYRRSPDVARWHRFSTLWEIGQQMGRGCAESLAQSNQNPAKLTCCKLKGTWAWPWQIWGGAGKSSPNHKLYSKRTC